jgi:hypothetical protein
MAHSAAAKQPLAFRVLPRTLEHLKRRAREAGQPQNALAERCIEEGLRMDEHPLIYFRDGAAGRRPAVLGTRLDEFLCRHQAKDSCRNQVRWLSAASP